MTKIVEIVSIAIAEFTQAEFLGQQDPQVKSNLRLTPLHSQGRVVPDESQLGRDFWETRARLSVGGLLASGCEGAMLLAGAEPERQGAARDLGLHMALALRFSCSSYQHLHSLQSP